MRILFVTDYYAPEINAAAIRVHARSKRWAAWGHEVTVVTSAPNFRRGRVYEGYRNRIFQRETIDGVDVRRVWTYIYKNEGVIRRTLDQLSFLPGAVLAGLFAPKPDVVVATSPTLFAALAAWIVAGLRRRPFVLEIGDLLAASVGAVGAVRRKRPLRLLAAIELALYRRAKTVVVQTERLKRMLRRMGVPGDRIVVIPNGVELDELSKIQPPLGRRPDRLVIRYFGNIGPAQGLERILDVAECVQKRTDRILFVFNGEGAHRRRLERLVFAKGLTNIRIEDPVPLENIRSLLEDTDVALVCLSPARPFKYVIPSKLLVSLGAGLPVVLVAPEGEAARIVEHVGCGIRLAGADTNRIADQILSLVNDGKRLAEMASAARQAASHYDQNRSSADYFRVLRSFFSASK